MALIFSPTCCEDDQGTPAADRYKEEFWVGVFGVQETYGVRIGVGSEILKTLDRAVFSPNESMITLNLPRWFHCGTY